MNRRLLLAVAGWLTTAVAATAVGVATIGLLGRPLAGGSGDVLTREAAGEALAGLTASASPTPSGSPSSPPASPRTRPPVPPRATPSASPEPSAGTTRTASPRATASPPARRTPAATPPATSKVITTRGGSVIARCDGRLVTLRSWSPAQGYVVDDVEPGPDTKAEVKFERGDDEDEVEIEVRCSATGPVHTVEFG